MKKILFVVYVSLVTSASFSQSTLTSENKKIFRTENKKKPLLSVNFMLNDFRTADRIKSSSVSSVFAHKGWSKISEMSPGLSINYMQGLTDHIDFMASLGGSFADFNFKNVENASTPSSNRFLLEADANAVFKLLTDKYIVNPYLSAGVGASLYNASYGAYIPFGFGIQFKLSEESFLFTNAQYRLGITDKSSNHFNYSIGFAAPLFGDK